MIAGTVLAVIAGLLLGMFQLAHRRAQEELEDRILRLTILLAVAAIVVVVVVLLSESRIQIASIPVASVLHFAVSGLIHFYLGFILFGYSQASVGTGRTGVLMGTTPVYSAVIGYVVFSEKLAPLVLTGIAVVITGVMVVSGSRISGERHPRKRDFLFGLGTALCYATSPIFVRFGLQDYDYPTVGVGIGMLVALLASLVTFLVRRARPVGSPLQKSADTSPVIPTHAVARKGVLISGIAGIFIGVATWVRYLALSLSPIAVVTTMSRVSIPLVLLLSPVVLTSRAEKPSTGTWIGAGLIICGSILIGFFG